MTQYLPLFGGSLPWSSDAWTSSDDRVRGGSSQSYLDVSSNCKFARFHGVLDITTLGGAGFASQRSTREKSWDLSGWKGVLIGLGKGDAKKYTFIIKDEVLPRRGIDGPEGSTMSWEYEFGIADGESGAEGEREVRIAFSELKPTFRGKAKKDAEPLNLARVKRFSFMMRSYFGDQEGKFGLEIRSVMAYRDNVDDGNEDSKGFPRPYRDNDEEDSLIGGDVEKGEVMQQSLVTRLFAEWTRCVRIR